MAQGRLKVYGWGREGEGLTPDEEAFVVNGYHHMFGVSEFPGHTVPAPADYALRAPRLTPPAALGRICSSAPYDRALHAHSKGFTDSVRIMLNLFTSAPDGVAWLGTGGGRR
jgi:alkyldihydroxyacetonephosphate synthase